MVTTPFVAYATDDPHYQLSSAVVASVIEYYNVTLNPLSKQWILEIREAFQTFQPLTATGYCPPNMAPVYRLWNNRVDSNHRYTTALTTAQQMLAQGWVAKGYGPNSVVMCALR